eukprot:gene11517-8201_t
MGTAFLTTHESGAPLSYKRVLLQRDGAARQRQVCFTKGFSGRSAQGLRNAFTEHMKPATDAAADLTPQRVILPFPYQNTLTTALRKKAVTMENVEYQSLWAGQRYAACRSVAVRELVASLVMELQQARTFDGGVDGDLGRRMCPDRAPIVQPHPICRSDTIRDASVRAGGRFCSWFYLRLALHLVASCSTRTPSLIDESLL